MPRRHPAFLPPVVLPARRPQPLSTCRVRICATATPNVLEADAVPRTKADGKSVAIVGAGLAGLVTAMELVDAGCRVDLYDTRPFVGGKVGSWQDRDGNHIEMGLHVFFGCYYNLFEIMAKTGSFKHLLLKEHTHQFVNLGADVQQLDFRLGPVGAPFHGLKAFATTGQLSLVDKIRNAIALGSSVIVRGLVDLDGAMESIRELDNISFAEWFMSKGGTRASITAMWDPVAYALGFINCDKISARCMLTIFQLFAARTEASVLRMLEGSPNDFLTKPIVDYITQRGARIHLSRRVRNVLYEPLGDTYRITGLEVMDGSNMETVTADVYVAACDVAGAKRLLPKQWRSLPEFQRLDRLRAVPVVTVQLRFDGWVTELSDSVARADVSGDRGYGIDNLLYTADAEFSCFADLAVTSPTHYFKPGEGSLLQCVLTPGDPHIARSDAQIVERVLQQVRRLFPSAVDMQCTWSSVVKLPESLYREEPGMDPCRPRQKTSVVDFFMAGSFTYQDYIDSMEGACKSGRLAATAILEYVAAQK